MNRRDFLQLTGLDIAAPTLPAMDARNELSIADFDERAAAALDELAELWLKECEQCILG